ALPQHPMLEGNDNSEELAQAIRIIHKDQPPSSIPPPGPDDIFYVDCHVDHESKKPFILWDDILQSFQDVVQVRHKARLLPFMKGPDFRTLEPRRIAALLNAVLDIVLGNPLATTDVISSRVLKQELLSPTSQREEREEKDKDSIVLRDVNTTASPRRNPAYSLENEAMDKYRNNEDSAFAPIPQVPQFILDTEPPANNTESQSTKSISIQLGNSIRTNLGDNAAQVTLGDRYRNGDGVDQDYQRAMEWYLKAAAQGNADAHKHIGCLYDQGHGVLRDYAQAADWYLKAAEQGHATAQNSIGCMYYAGEGVPQDYSRAMDWYLKAGEQGHSAAQNNVGYMYSIRYGVPQDYSLAMDWYLKAAKQGLPAAQNGLGNMYEEKKGIPRDYSRAMDWYLKAAEQGHPAAQNNIGNMYEKGKRVPQDYSLAMDWYLKAAEQGLPAAQNHIGDMYEYGRGVPQDYSRAMNWFLKASEQGHAGAQCSIGGLFEYGQGVPQDLNRAMEWYRKATNQGFWKAGKILVSLEYNEDSAFYSTTYTTSASARITSQVIDNYTHVDDRPYFLRGNH
ncbi:hypothetical protein BGX24_007761, partial [Mortierella sp. AD032]